MSRSVPKSQFGIKSVSLKGMINKRNKKLTQLIENIITTTTKTTTTIIIIKIIEISRGVE